MADVTLVYVADKLPEQLRPGECTFRRTTLSDGSLLHWRLVACVLDEIGDDAGTPRIISVAVNPGGASVETGEAATRTWGISRVGAGQWRWDVTPSINAVDIWHHTPTIVGVPEPPPWEADHA